MQSLAVLAELGITVYRPRAPETPAREAAARPAAATATAGPVRPAAPAGVQPATAPPAAAVPAGLRVALGFGSQWPRLRAHLLKAWQARDVDPAQADIVFGGRGRVLALPSLGALAGNPALKRQAWQAWRGLRRNGGVSRG